MDNPPHIPFNRAHLTGAEFAHMETAIQQAHLAGNGDFSRLCREWLEDNIGSRRALLTHSCTGALEMAVTLADVRPGDEVVLPSFAFVSAATAVVNRGGVPVFVDIRPDTLCIDEALVPAAVTERTKAILVVHYAGVACEMEPLLELAQRRGVIVIEDAAHGILASVDGRALGGIGHLGAVSFHETKNVTCGEGGALLVNDDRLVERAEIVHEKGTNRQLFFRGAVDKYTWVDEGSSYVLSDLAAAFLWGQLQHADEITRTRLGIWSRYHDAFADLESEGLVRRPAIPSGSNHNAHMYYLLLPDLRARSRFIADLAEENINAVFHFVPLHSSPAGHRYGREASRFDVTDAVSDRLVRLPLWAGMSDDEVTRVIDATRRYLLRRTTSSAA
jgi:dTDP-4-amino-4,6-dideoxygalactose transaminase